jgi:CubicO group peptidase (beta-lactamase class C family)
MKILSWFFPAALLAACIAVASAQGMSKHPVTAESFARAAAYSESSNGVALLVVSEGRILHERYAARNGPGVPRELASGTKSFCGILACLLARDGLLDLSEPVSRTIPEWRDIPGKKDITIRQLLTLTSGLRTGGERGAVPGYMESLDAPLDSPPGRLFRYGAVPFQVFGELVKRKLGGRDPVDYLNERLFLPLGIRPGRWTRGSDGNSHLPSGAAFTARDWARFGEFIRLGGVWDGRELVSKELMDSCFEGTPANPAYGLTFWLNRETSPELRELIPQLENGSEYLYDLDYVPKDLVFAAGAGKQRLYILPSLGLVIVRQGERIRESLTGAYRPDFSDQEFFRLLFGG